ncbi:hypothetical protein ACWD3J_13755 [Streptomyces sp. NPDC002755]
MGEPRPERPDATPEEQAERLRSTGNGPTVDGEADVLEAEFGEADSNDVYGAPQTEGGDAA